MGCIWLREYSEIMEDTLAILGSIFRVAVLVGFFCCLPASVVGLLAYGVLVALPRGKAAHERLASQLGLQPDSRRKFRFWGTHQGRAFFIDLGRVGVEAQLRESLRGYAYSNRRSSVGPQTSFETAFKARQNVERLSPAARAAMLAFRRKHESLFLEGLPIHPKPEPQPETRVFLETDLGRDLNKVTPADAQALLAELIEVARVIEAM